MSWNSIDRLSKGKLNAMIVGAESFVNVAHCKVDSGGALTCNAGFRDAVAVGADQVRLRLEHPFSSDPIYVVSTEDDGTAQVCRVISHTSYDVVIHVPASVDGAHVIAIGIGGYFSWLPRTPRNAVNLSKSLEALFSVTSGSSMHLCAGTVRVVSGLGYVGSNIGFSSTVTMGGAMIKTATVNFATAFSSTPVVVLGYESATARGVWLNSRPTTTQAVIGMDGYAPDFTVHVLAFGPRAALWGPSSEIHPGALNRLVTVVDDGDIVACEYDQGAAAITVDYGMDTVIQIGADSYRFTLDQSLTPTHSHAITAQSVAENQTCLRNAGAQSVDSKHSATSDLIHMIGIGG